MIYEIYNNQGIATPVEYEGTLEGMLNKIGGSEWLFGVKHGRREAIHVEQGRNVLNVCECPEEEWDKSSIVKVP